MRRIKILTLAFLLCLSFLGLTACGSKEDGKTGQDKAKNVESEKKLDKKLEEDALESVKYFGYSQKEAVEQLVTKGYSEEEAKAAFKVLNTNWVDQATKRAKDHIETVGYYSKANLIGVLVEYDGFIKEEAEQGVENLNRDWKALAVKAAKDKVNLIGYKKAEDKVMLKELLMDEKFTEEEAEYGANNCGLD